MKYLLKKAFDVRKKLILSKRSFLDGKWAIEKMRNIEYWIAHGNVDHVVQHHQNTIRVLMPSNFIHKFDELLKNQKDERN